MVHQLISLYCLYTSSEFGFVHKWKARQTPTHTKVNANTPELIHKYSYKNHHRIVARISNDAINCVLSWFYFLYIRIQHWLDEWVDGAGSDCTDGQTTYLCVLLSTTHTQRAGPSDGNFFDSYTHLGKPTKFFVCAHLSRANFTIYWYIHIQVSRKPERRSGRRKTYKNLKIYLSSPLSRLTKLLSLPPRQLVSLPLMVAVAALLLFFFFSFLQFVKPVFLSFLSSLPHSLSRNHGCLYDYIVHTF